MTKEEQFKKQIEEKIKNTLKENNHNKGVIINDDNHDWGGSPHHYENAIKKDLI